MRQPSPTVKEQAAAWGISERSVYMLRAIERLRPELLELRATSGSKTQ